MGLVTLLYVGCLARGFPLIPRGYLSCLGGLVIVETGCVRADL